jgi:hypothetical protein
MTTTSDEEYGELYPEDSPSLDVSETSAARRELRSGNRVRGFTSALGALVGYLVVPLILLEIWTRQLGIFRPTEGTLLAVLLLGIPIVLVAFFAGYNIDDVKNRSIARLVQSVLTVLYLYMVVGRGPIELNLFVLLVTLDITAYFYLLVFGTLLHALSPAWDLVHYYRTS